MTLVHSDDAPGSSNQDSGFRAASCWTLSSHTWQDSANSAIVSAAKLPPPNSLNTPLLVDQPHNNGVAPGSHLRVSEHGIGGTVHEHAENNSNGETEYNALCKSDSYAHKHGHADGHNGHNVCDRVSRYGLRSRTESVDLSTSSSMQHLTVQHALPQSPEKGRVGVPASAQLLSCSNSGRHASSSSPAPFSAVGYSSAAAGRGLVLQRSGSMAFVPLQHAFSRSFMLSAAGCPVLKVTLQVRNWSTHMWGGKQAHE
jgi:hypothetical protein